MTKQLRVPIETDVLDDNGKLSITHHRFQQLASQRLNTIGSVKVEDSDAVDVDGLRADFNALLSALRMSGVLQ